MLKMRKEESVWKFKSTVKQGITRNQWSTRQAIFAVIGCGMAALMYFIF